MLAMKDIGLLVLGSDSSIHCLLVVDETQPPGIQGQDNVKYHYFNICWWCIIHIHQGYRDRKIINIIISMFVVGG